MPPKMRELIKELEKAGFINRGGKGVHKKFVHSRVYKPVILSGNPGDDALDYQISPSIKESRNQKNER